MDNESVHAFTDCMALRPKADLGRLKELFWALMLAVGQGIGQTVEMSENELPPIKAWFIPTETPHGTALSI